MIILWLIMILSPIFVLVSLWTGLNKKLWVKILNTVISVFLLIMVFVAGDRQNKVDDLQWSIDYAVGRDMNYISCIDKNVDNFDVMCEDCIIENVKLLRKTYDMN